jgi:outer membrane lipoprotein-sorting protein
MKNFTVLILALMTGVCHAQNRDPQAQALLNQMSAKANGYSNMVLEFKYALDNHEENIHQETRGDITLVGYKYVLNILGITRIFDGEKLITISPEDEEVTISKQNTVEENTITPSELLNFYKEGYNYKMDIIQNVKGRKIQYIKLNPIDSNSEISYVLLGIDTTTKHVYKLIEIGNNATETTLTINTFKTNQPLSKSLFTFDTSKYSDYYINNLD